MQSVALQKRRLRRSCGTPRTARRHGRRRGGSFSLLRDDSPARHGVTLRAIGAHFPLMNVGVTVLAILADVIEHRLRVASRAFHLFVQSAQGVVGRVVVELEDAPNRTPGYC